MPLQNKEGDHRRAAGSIRKRGPEVDGESEKKDEEEERCVGGRCQEPDPKTGLDLQEVSGAKGSRGGSRRRHEGLRPWHSPTNAREEEAGRREGRAERAQN